MELYSVLITGANKGIGLEFTRQLSNYRIPVKHIFATYRNEDTTQELKAIQNSSSPETKVHLIKMDVLEPTEVESARQVIEETVGDNGLTLLINNAAVLQWLSFPEITAENLRYHFSTNTVGPILMAQKMLPLLKKASSRSTKPGMSFSKAGILNISSLGSSFTNVSPGHLDLGAPGYKISKTALNMGMRVLAAVIKEDNILVVNICPGWVRTDMGTEQAHLLPQDSIAAMLETVPTLNEAHHGTLMDRFGKQCAW